MPPIPSFENRKGPKQIMAFGKFGTYKKVEHMIEAVELVRQRSKEDIEIVIAGTDSPNVKGYQANVEKKYNHIKNIKFTGYVEEVDVPEVFSASTAVVFPYTSTTGSSGVLHQAGSYGKAVILPNIGDLKDLIEDEGYRGEYFTPSNVESMADAIEKLVTDDGHRKSLAAKNYAAAAALPMEDIADWYLMHFESLVSK
ncbi:MAG: glycosyltransferase [Bacteroidota bacterium]